MKIVERKSSCLARGDVADGLLVQEGTREGEKIRTAPAALEAAHERVTPGFGHDRFQVRRRFLAARVSQQHLDVRWEPSILELGLAELNERVGRGSGAVI